jgi:hypothetical protein
MRPYAVGCVANLWDSPLAPSRLFRGKLRTELATKSEASINPFASLQRQLARSKYLRRERSRTCCRCDESMLATAKAFSSSYSKWETIDRLTLGREPIEVALGCAVGDKSDWLETMAASLECDP